MAFSENYKPILDQLHQDIVSEWGLNASAVYIGSPGLIINDAHAVIAPRNIATERGGEYGTARNPGSVFSVTIQGIFGATGAITRPIDDLFAKVDAICAVVEAGSVYGTTGMMPLVEDVSLDEITGETDGSGQRRLIVELLVSFVVQRSRG